MSERPAIAILYSMLTHERQRLRILEADLEAIEQSRATTLETRDSQATYVADIETAITEITRASEPIST